MQKIEIKNRGTIAYQWLGDGPEVVVLINGAIFNQRQWTKIVTPYLVEKFHGKAKFLCYDYCGIGESSAREKPFELHDLIAELDDLLKALRLDKVHLLGISKGSMIALPFAAEHPEKVKSIGAVASPNVASEKTEEVFSTFDKRMEAVKELEDIWDERIDKANFDRMFNRVYASAIFMKEYNELSLIEKMKFAVVKKIMYPTIEGNYTRSLYDLFGYYTNREGLIKEAPYFKKALMSIKDIPVLLIHGKADTTLPIEMSREIHGMVKGSKLIEVDNMGHVDPLMKKKYRDVVFGEYANFLNANIKQ